MESVLTDNARVMQLCKQAGVAYYLIDEDYCLQEELLSGESFEILR